MRLTLARAQTVAILLERVSASTQCRPFSWPQWSIDHSCGSVSTGRLMMQVASVRSVRRPRARHCPAAVRIELRRGCRWHHPCQRLGLCDVDLAGQSVDRSRFGSLRSRLVEEMADGRQFTGLVGPLRLGQRHAVQELRPRARRCVSGECPGRHRPQGPGTRDMQLPPGSSSRLDEGVHLTPMRA